MGGSALEIRGHRQAKTFIGQSDTRVCLNLYSGARLWEASRHRTQLMPVEWARSPRERV